VGNAIKFTSSGCVSIKAWKAEENESEILLHFAVSDTGVGIPADSQEIIFDAFRQADGSTTRRFGGTGLGLAISQRLVTLMQGRIWVQSEVDRGSTFHFTTRVGVPDQKSNPSPQGSASEVAECGSIPVIHESRIRVLVCEDNPVNRTVASRLLERAGFVVGLAHNGQSAIEEFQRQPWDVVLMDLQMPEMDGFEATRRIRELNEAGRTVPIVAITAHAMQGDRERCFSAGMNDYLPKPFDPRELIAVVERTACPVPQRLPASEGPAVLLTPGIDAGDPLVCVTD
jgi:CheY-like chemotaxis protein